MERDFYQKTKLGKIRHIKLWLEDNKIFSSFGYIDSDKDQQQTCDTVDPLYSPGHALYKTGEQQAVVKFERRCQELIREGNKGTIEEARNSNPLSDLVLHPLSTSFRPPKPISDKPCIDKKDVEKARIPNRKLQTVIDYARLYAEKKYNGLYINVVKCSCHSEFHLYTISNKSCDDQYPWLREWFQTYTKEYVPDDSLISVEVVAGDGTTMEEFETIKAMKPNTSGARAAQILREYLAKDPANTVGARVTNVLFWAGSPLAFSPYSRRLECAIAAIGPAQIAQRANDTLPFVNVSMAWYSTDFYEARKRMEDNAWEGLVLKDIEHVSSFSMSSEYNRPLGCWKWKSRRRGDFFVTGVLQGTGANYGKASTLLLGQYDERGNQLDCGGVGSGITDAMIASGIEELIGQVVEVEFSDRFDPKKVKSGKDALQFPVFIQVRDDKEPKDCIYFKDE